jgi:hypothetical protein
MKLPSRLIPLTGNRSAAKIKAPSENLATLLDRAPDKKRGPAGPRSDQTGCDGQVFSSSTVLPRG